MRDKAPLVSRGAVAAHRAVTEGMRRSFGRFTKTQRGGGIPSVSAFHAEPAPLLRKGSLPPSTVVPFIVYADIVV